MKTPKLQQVCWHLVTVCYNKQISGIVRMACDSLWEQVCCKLSTGLLQAVNRVVASWLFQQACRNLFQQVVTSLRMTSYNKPDFNRLVATWWNWQACCNLLTSCNKPIKLTTCSKSEAFLAVYNIWNSLWNPPILWIYLRSNFAIHLIWDETIKVYAN